MYCIFAIKLVHTYLSKKIDIFFQRPIQYATSPTNLYEVVSDDLPRR